ncbi:MAG: RsmE family RNA methyltransferase [Bryobacteraceae bacterium]
MARRRFFVDEVHNHRAELNGEEARHLSHVLRVEVGQKYEISDNTNVYLAEVETARKERIVFHTLEKLPFSEPLVHVTLLAALIKFDHFEMILEKATELGVSSIVPVEAIRSERGLERAVEKRLTRWRRIVLESSQQSRRARLPEVTSPLEFAHALKQESDARLFLDEERTGVPVLTALSLKPPTVSLLVGPEGGWTEPERTSASAAGWTSASLGPQILRAETAAIAALAIVNAAFY